MLAKIFPKNEHIVDRVLRIIVGLALLSLIVIGPHTYWGLIGLLPLLTGIFGTCPAYTLLGISTCRAGADKTTGTKSCCCG
ncbi:MAG: DUF2892 domain-containing protein [Deltaproteobacteria bacterium]|nr:DUF2892 domain-containing protein [Deltaproteobacteria bacterium]